MNVLPFLLCSVNRVCLFMMLQTRERISFQLGGWGGAPNVWRAANCALFCYASGFLLPAHSPFDYWFGKPDRQKQKDAPPPLTLHCVRMLFNTICRPLPHNHNHKTTTTNMHIHTYAWSWNQSCAFSLQGCNVSSMALCLFRIIRGAGNVERGMYIATHLTH